MHAIKAFLRGGALPEPTYRTLWSPQVGAPMLRMSNIGYNMQTEPTKCESRDQRVGRNRLAFELAGGVDSGHRKSLRREHAQLHQHRRLIPVDMLVVELAAANGYSCLGR